MTPTEVKKYFKTLYNFRKETGMSACSLGNWLKWGFIPEPSQLKLERITKGALIAEWKEYEPRGTKGT